MKKTLEEHKEYIEQLARVSFYFTSRWMKEKYPGTPLGELLRDRAPLFRHALDYTDHETKWDNPACQQIMAKANEFQELQPDEFEETMYAEIKELAMERAEQMYPSSVGIGMPEGYNAGSLKYDPPKSTLPPSYCCFHIANAVAPKSIFDDPDYLPQCFHELMDKSEKEYGYDTLYTGTWLNDHPKWLALFPEEWINNLSPKHDDIRWHFGFWGQLVTARGTFNYKGGNYVREHGVLKLKSRVSHCSFDAMRNKLAGLDMT